MRKLIQSFFSGLALVLLAGAACAQNPVSASQAEMQMSPEKLKERMAKHQAEMHDKLKITAAQESAWKSFIGIVSQSYAETKNDAKNVDNLTTPERMQNTLERMKEHQAQLQIKLDATKKFYVVLTLEQQKIFDESHRRMRQEMQERMAKQMQKKDGMMDKP